MSKNILVEFLELQFLHWNPFVGQHNSRRSCLTQNVGDTVCNRVPVDIGDVIDAFVP